MHTDGEQSHKERNRNWRLNRWEHERHAAKRKYDEEAIVIDSDEEAWEEWDHISELLNEYLPRSLVQLVGAYLTRHIRYRDGPVRERDRDQ